MDSPRRTTVPKKPDAPQRVVVARAKRVLRSSALPPVCVCGKLVQFYSALLKRGFCGDPCYEKAIGAIRKGR
jgi:hypothetical protein